MSDTVVLVAIVVPATAMVTIGTLAIVFGRHINFTANAGPAEFHAETKSEDNQKKNSRSGKHRAN